MNQMRFRHSRRYVYVYYEGEGSEKAYLEFLKSRFHDVIIIKGKRGFYPNTEKDLKKPNSDLNKNWDTINEIWFFFDIDPDAMMDGRIANWKKLEDVIKFQKKEASVMDAFFFCLDYKKSGNFAHAEFSCKKSTIYIRKKQVPNAPRVQVRI